LAAPEDFVELDKFRRTVSHLSLAAGLPVTSFELIVELAVTFDSSKLLQFPD